VIRGGVAVRSPSSPAVVFRRSKVRLGDQMHAILHVCFVDRGLQRVHVYIVTSHVCERWVDLDVLK
jgi:hypothetical protein